MAGVFENKTVECYKRIQPEKCGVAFQAVIFSDGKLSFCAFRCKAVVGLFLAEHFPAENVIGEDPDGGKEKPEYSKQQAYLTEEIERELFIIPDLPVKPEVDDTAADKFKYRYYSR